MAEPEEPFEDIEEIPGEEGDGKEREHPPSGMSGQRDKQCRYGSQQSRSNPGQYPLDPVRSLVRQCLHTKSIGFCQDKAEEHDGVRFREAGQEAGQGAVVMDC